MLYAALALIVLGVVLTLLAGPFGFVILIAGVVLVVLYLLGIGRKAVEPPA